MKTKFIIAFSLFVAVSAFTAEASNIQDDEDLFEEEYDDSNEVSETLCYIKAL